MKIEAIYDRIVSDYIATPLSRMGFQRARPDFFIRWKGDCLQRVASLLTTNRATAEGKILVTVCVGYRSLEAFLHKCSFSTADRVQQPCAMATDLGHLHAPYQYQEWRILPHTDPIVMGVEIGKELKEFGVPFLERFSTLDEALKAWEAGVRYNLGARAVFYVAAAYWLRGDRNRARQVVSEQIELHRRELHEQGTRVHSQALHRLQRFLDELDKQA